MSYQVLARKWRPRNFDTLVGQEHVVRALVHALTEKRLHHAYLFTGTRGVGKTTIARILAKSLNCEQGLSASPCGICSTCCEIDSGRFVDLLEVDAATNTRVDEMRQLLENAVYAPTRGRYKVYVIDEVHMLSNAAFNAMLKTLEEPPEHIKFILATTDPQKIPVTVLSRCLQFNLKQMSSGAIAEHLAMILMAESVSYEANALLYLARAADGSMRDALSLLDQAIAYGAGQVMADGVREMLGVIDNDYLLRILEALAAGDVQGLYRTAGEMAVRSTGFAVALQELARLFTRLQLIQFLPEDDASELEDARLRALALRFPVEYVQLCYQISLQGREELPMGPDPFSGFLMVLLRLHAFRPNEQEECRKVIPDQFTASNLEKKSSFDGKQEKPKNKVENASALIPARDTEDFSIARESGSDSIRSGADDMMVGWHRLLCELKLNGMARELAQHCELRSLEKGSCVLRLPPLHKHLQIKPAQDKLQQALSDYQGCSLVLKIEIAEVEMETPAALAQRGRFEKHEAAVAAIEEDRFVRDVIDLFDATLPENSIKSID